LLANCCPIETLPSLRCGFYEVFSDKTVFGPLELFLASPLLINVLTSINFFHFDFYRKCVLLRVQSKIVQFFFVQDFFQIGVQSIQIGSRTKSISHSCMQNAPRFAELQFQTHFSLMCARLYAQFNIKRICIHMVLLI